MTDISQMSVMFDKNLYKKIRVIRQICENSRSILHI